MVRGCGAARGGRRQRRPERQSPVVSGARHRSLDLVSSRRLTMNRDYSYPAASYMQLTELQPSSSYHHHYDLAQADPGAAASYEMTAGAAPAAGHTLPTSLHAHTLDPRKSRPDTLCVPVCSSDEYEAMSGCEMPTGPPSVASMPAPSVRKRKTSYATSSAYDEDDDSRSSRSAPDKKSHRQNHSEIEKRRRDKMNTYISELSAIVPMCGAMSRKLDKLTVLRMAVQHLRVVRGALASCPLSACPRPAYVSERELNRILLHAARDCFLLVVGCDRGRLLYVSASVTDMLHYDQDELLGQSLFDILHPKDVAKVKEQLSSSDLSPRERLIDAKTMLPVKAELGTSATRLCPGARRSFYCRIKFKMPHTVKDEPDPSSKLRKKPHDKKYCVVHCTGYLKSWAPAEVSEGSAEGGEEEACHVSCLVAVARALPDPPAPAPRAPSARPLQFLSRHATDGKYLFVDQRVTLALGFLPQELLGTSLYEVVGGATLGAVASAHKAALARRAPALTPPYAARRKDGSTALLQTQFKPFKNPWTRDVECLLAYNTLVPSQQAPAAAYDRLQHAEGGGAEGGALAECDAEVQRLIESQVEAHKIGSAIAEEARRRSPPALPLDLPPDLLQDAIFNNQAFVDNILCNDFANQVRNNVPLSAAGAASPAGAEEEGGARGGGDESPATSPLALDGNGEAAMAVIMSLLEADAGLGGPVNFSGLPWPLP